jgi:hypothetical protein
MRMVSRISEWWVSLEEEARAMHETASPAENAAPVKRGSALKGMGCSLLFQFVALCAGLVLMGADFSFDRMNRRQVAGMMLMLLFGITQWAMVIPMARRWKARGKTRSVSWLRGTSIAGSIPSVILLGMGLFGIVMNLGGDLILKLRGKI